MMIKSKILFIVIDGCRPDGVRQASTPTMDALCASGSSSFTVQTVTPSITLPAHFSIMSSRKPHAHNVITNSGNPAVSPGTFTLMEAAKYQGLSTAAFYSWEQLRNLTPPGVLDQSFMINTLLLEENVRDMTIVQQAGPAICGSQPDFCFVYLEGTDIAGHDYGWMSEPYLKAIERADQAIKVLIDMLSDSGLNEKYTIFVVSDHGGSGKHHADPKPSTLTVPWIASGKGIRRGHTIDQPLSVLDITPTIAALMGLPMHWSWQGKVIEEILA